MNSGNCTFVEGYPGSDAICFHAKVSGRSVGVVVPGGTIRKLAEVLRHTNHMGHTTWHLNNPDAPLPCSTCSTTKAEDA